MRFRAAGLGPVREAAEGAQSLGARLRSLARGNHFFRPGADGKAGGRRRSGLCSVMTIFEKIAAREIPAKIVHETEDFLAVEDVRPQAPIHILIVPKRPIPRIAEA